MAATDILLDLHDYALDGVRTDRFSNSYAPTSIFYWIPHGPVRLPMCTLQCIPAPWPASTPSHIACIRRDVRSAFSMAEVRFGLKRLTAGTDLHNVGNALRCLFYWIRNNKFRVRLTQYFQRLIKIQRFCRAKCGVGRALVQKVAQMWKTGDEKVYLSACDA